MPWAAPLRLTTWIAATIGFVTALPLAHASSQEPWPNARCYALTRGAWAAQGDTTRARIEPPPSAPDTLILEQTLQDAFEFWQEPRDTALHVVHGWSSNRAWSGIDPSYVWWRQPASDRLVVWLGTGHGGVDFEFQVADDSLRGFVDTHSDRSGAPFWRAPVAGRRVRCPPAPPPLGRLRLSVSDSVPPSKPAGWRGLVLATERPFDCGGAWINYYGLGSAGQLAVRVRGIAEPTGGCKVGPGPATTYFDLPARSRRVTLLIKHEGNTNRFVLVRTNRSLALITQHATTVIADERVRVWPRGDPRDE